MSVTVEVSTFTNIYVQRCVSVVTVATDHHPLQVGFVKLVIAKGHVTRGNVSRNDDD